MTTYFPDKPTVVSSNRILYTASPFARSSLLHLQEVGELTALQPHTSSRSNLSSFLFFVVVDGEGTLQYEGKTYADLFRRGLCLPSDNKMTPEQQKKVIEVIHRCFR